MAYISAFNLEDRLYDSVDLEKIKKVLPFRQIQYIDVEGEMLMIVSEKSGRWVFKMSCKEEA